MLFPFPPIPIHAAAQLYITTVHYCTGVTSSSIQYRNLDHLLSLYEKRSLSGLSSYGKLGTQGIGIWRVATASDNTNNLIS